MPDSSLEEDSMCLVTCGRDGLEAHIENGVPLGQCVGAGHLVLVPQLHSEFEVSAPQLMVIHLHQTTQKESLD